MKMCKTITVKLTNEQYLFLQQWRNYKTEQLPGIEISDGLLVNRIVDVFIRQNQDALEKMFYPFLNPLPVNERQKLNVADIEKQKEIILQYNMMTDQV